MDHKSIEQLLDKYFEGVTTLEEEASLREYFRREQSLPPSLESYRPLFRYFEEEQSLQLPSGFDRRLRAQLTDTPGLTTRIRRLAPLLSRIAAVLLIAFGIWWLYPVAEAPSQQAVIDWSKYEPETPEEAYRITRMALVKLSGELTEGTQKAAREVDKMEKIGRYVK